MVRTVLSRTRPVIPQEKKHRLTQTLSSLVPGRGWAGAARDGRIHPLCTPAHALTAKSGAETPQRVSVMARAAYRPFDDSVPWWLRVDVCEHTRRAHTQSQRNSQHSHTAEATTAQRLFAAAADRPHSSSSSTQQRRRRGSGGRQLRASEPPIVRLMTPCLGGCELFGSVTSALCGLLAVVMYVCVAPWFFCYK